MAITWTQHAKQRAQERFPGVDLNAAYLTACKPNRKLRGEIRKLCPVMGKRYMRGKASLRHYLVTRDRLVFVLGRGEVVITVFKLEDNNGSDPVCV